MNVYKRARLPITVITCRKLVVDLSKGTTNETDEDEWAPNPLPTPQQSRHPGSLADYYVDKLKDGIVGDQLTPIPALHLHGQRVRGGGHDRHRPVHYWQNDGGAPAALVQPIDGDDGEC